MDAVVDVKYDTSVASLTMRHVGCGVRVRGHDRAAGSVRHAVRTALCDTPGVSMKIFDVRRWGVHFLFYDIPLGFPHA